MSDYVLFSPVGTTDPYRDQYEGPLLQIMRHYQPKTVYLFFTAEMAKLEQKDNRFLRAVERQAENLGRDTEQIRVVEIYSWIEIPSDFDAFAKPYQDALHRIETENRDSHILLNVSSGTPQMIAMSCLLASSSYLGRTYRCIQVVTPAGESGTKSPYMKEFAEGEIDNLLDNLPEAKNRCLEPDILSFVNTMNQERITKLIERYDYAGAAQMFDEYPQSFSDNARKWTEHFLMRANYKVKEAKRLIPDDDMELFDPYPVKNDRALPIYEFFLCAQLKYLKGDWSDLLLRLSPLLTELIVFYLVERLKFPLDKVVYKTSRGDKLSKEKMLKYDHKLYDFIDQSFSGRFSDNYVMLSNMLPVLEYLINSAEKTPRDSDQVLAKFKELRNIEEILRNEVAHQMTSVSDQWAKLQTGLDFKGVYQKLESLLGLVMQTDFGSGWRDLPKRFNKMLLQLING